MLDSESDSGASRAFRALSMSALVGTVVIILSGDLVQATGSGAGCGENWPRCDGALIPAFDDAATGIEFTHRILTFVLSMVIVALVVRARKSFTPGHRIRRAVGYVAALFVLEVAIGALLVVFGWVDDDGSFGRVVADSLHLVNTFLLVAALVVVVYYAAGGREASPGDLLRTASDVFGGAVVLLLIGLTGAISSLADTLFPADSVLEGIREEFGSAAPFLLRVRAVHPIVAIAGGIVVFVIAKRLAGGGGRSVSRYARAVHTGILIQLGLGALNLALLTPLETQIAHLLLADVVWIAYVLMMLSAAGSGSPVVVGSDRRRSEAVS